MSSEYFEPVSEVPGRSRVARAAAGAITDFLGSEHQSVKITRQVFKKPDGKPPSLESILSALRKHVEKEGITGVVVQSADGEVYLTRGEIRRRGPRKPKEPASAVAAAPAGAAAQ